MEWDAILRQRINRQKSEITSKTWMFSQKKIHIALLMKVTEYPPSPPSLRSLIWLMKERSPQLWFEFGI